MNFRMVGKHTEGWVLPGPSSPENKGNSIASEDSSQTREVWVAICWLLEHTLIQLQLKKREMTVIKSRKKEWEDGAGLDRWVAGE